MKGDDALSQINIYWGLNMFTKILQMIRSQKNEVKSIKANVMVKVPHTLINNYPANSDYDLELYTVYDECDAFYISDKYTTEGFIKLIHNDSKKDFSFEVSGFSNLFFTYNGKIVVCCESNYIYEFDLKTKSLKIIICRGNKLSKSSYAISHDKKKILFFENKHFIILDLMSGKDFKSTEIMMKYNPCVGFINGDLFFVFSEMVHMSSEEPLYFFQSYQFSKDSIQNCIIRSSVALAPWEKNSKYEKWHCSNWSNGFYRRVSVSPDGKVLAVANTIICIETPDSRVSRKISFINFYNLADLPPFQLGKKKHNEIPTNVLRPFYALISEHQDSFNISKNPWTNKGDFIFCNKAQDNKMVVEMLSFTLIDKNKFSIDRQIIKTYDLSFSRVRVLVRDDEVEIWREAVNKSVDSAESNKVWEKEIYSYLEQLQNLNTTITNVLIIADFHIKELISLISLFAYDRRAFRPAILLQQLETISPPDSLDHAVAGDQKSNAAKQVAGVVSAPATVIRNQSGLLAVASNNNDAVPAPTSVNHTVTNTIA